MKKQIILSIGILLICTSNLIAQVGINTENPQGVFHIDAAGDNPSTGTPTTEQQYNDVVVNNLGYMGIGTTNPTNRLHIVADPSTGNDPVNIGGLAVGDIHNDYILGVTPDGVVKSLGRFDELGFPTPALFVLETEINDFLDGASGGDTEVVPMSMIKNNIYGLSYDNSTSEISLPVGTYEFVFVYEAIHNLAGCSISSYIVDFPSGISLVNNAPHTDGSLAIHGGTISQTITLTSPTTYTINMGRGDSGNCYGSGMLLKSGSTQLLIYRIGS